MKRIKKIFTSIISMVLIIAMVGTSCVFATGSEDSVLPEGISVERYNSERAATNQESLFYSQYTLNLEGIINNDSSNTRIVNAILSYCIPSETTSTIENGADTIIVSGYKVNGLHALIPMCSDDASISSVETLNAS